METLGQLEREKARAKDLLSCMLCSQTYDDPRSLPCMHTFCRRCLQRHCDFLQAESSTKIGSFLCPTCRSHIGLPRDGVAGFPTDKRIQHIKDLVVTEMAQKISRNVQARRANGTTDATSESTEALQSDNFEDYDDNFETNDDGYSYLSQFTRQPSLTRSRFGSQKVGYSSLRETRRDYRQAFDSSSDLHNRTKTTAPTLLQESLNKTSSSSQRTINKDVDKNAPAYNSSSVLNGYNGSTTNSSDTSATSGTEKETYGYNSLREKHRKSYADLVKYYETASDCVDQQKDMPERRAFGEVDYRVQQNGSGRTRLRRSNSDLSPTHRSPFERKPWDEAKQSNGIPNQNGDSVHYPPSVPQKIFSDVKATVNIGKENGTCCSEAKLSDVPSTNSSTKKKKVPTATLR